MAESEGVMLILAAWSHVPPWITRHEGVLIKPAQLGLRPAMSVQIPGACAEIRGGTELFVRMPGMEDHRLAIRGYKKILQVLSFDGQTVLEFQSRLCTHCGTHTCRVVARGEQRSLTTFDATLRCDSCGQERQSEVSVFG